MVAQETYVEIVEQPASKSLRFRYECEGRSAGSIPGVSSTPENKTFPTIRVVGFKGKAYVVVSCVTKDAPYRAHPHNLVGREGCHRGVCKLEIPQDNMSVTFSNLGIQCVKKKQIEGALKLREDIRIDPFKSGFSHRSQPTSIDLNAVRLCFQVFIETVTRDENNLQIIRTVPLKPVVSEPIFDKKAMCDLIIVKLSDCVSPVDGGRKDIVLLCEKVIKEDIQVRFFEEKDGQMVWEGFGDFQPSQVHKQTAIWFRAPRYKNLGITEPVKVFVQLRRPSDGTSSEPLPFEFLPLDSGRPPFWSLRRNLNKKSLLDSILSSDPPFSVKRRHLDSVSSTSDISSTDATSRVSNSSIVEELSKSTSAVQTSVDLTAPQKEWCDYSEVSRCSSASVTKNDGKTFDEFMNQVVQLDAIFPESQNISGLSTCLINDAKKTSFDENSANYTNVQMALKNSIDLSETKYEDIIIVDASDDLVMEICPSVQENEQKTPKKRSKKTSDLSTRCSSPNASKRGGIFSRLFSKKQRLESDDTKRSSGRSRIGSKRQQNSSFGLDLTTRHQENQTHEFKLSSEIDFNGNNNNNLDSLKLELDLTDAQQYALYMAMAPSATRNKLDEMCYYFASEDAKSDTELDINGVLSNSEKTQA